MAGGLVVMTRVNPAQRFTKQNPCPICGGHKSIPTGHDGRCYGFSSSDGEWAHCTSDDHAGQLSRSLKDETFHHRLKGLCKCGVEHNPADPQPTFNGANKSQGQQKRREVNRTEHTVRDVDGSTAAFHVRIEYSDGKKVFKWRRPNGVWDLNGRSAAQMPLYGVHELHKYPDEAIIIVEGEKAQEALEHAGKLALGTVTGAEVIPDLDVLRTLIGHPVILWPDNDDVGRSHMDGIALRCQELGITVSRLTWPDAPSKGDAFDFFAAGGTVEILDDLIEQAEPYYVEAKPKRFTFYTASEMMQREPPEFLIDGVLVKDSQAALVGPAGSYKTFVAMDFALCVAAGYWWADRKVKSGPVIYISGEGSRGITKRIKAWEKGQRKVVSDNCLFMTEALQMLSPDQIDQFTAELADLPTPPVLIVVDTLARAIVGGEENSAKDMGLLVDAGDRLRRATGAAILYLHHANKDGGFRGSTSIPGGLDTIISIKAEDDLLTLKCDKQKDFDEFRPIHMVTREIDLSFYWPNTTSLVLDPATKGVNQFTEAQKRVLDLLVDTFGATGATSSQWEKVADEAGIARRTFYRARKELVEAGLVTADKEGRGARFIPTDEVSANSVPSEDGTFDDDNFTVWEG